MVEAPGMGVRKARLVRFSARYGISFPLSLIRLPPKKLPNPTPKVVMARPVTFWFALNVMVRKLKVSDPMQPIPKEQRRAIATATAPDALSPAAFPY